MSPPISDADIRSSRLDAFGTIVCLLIALGLRLLVILNEPGQLTLDRDAYLGIATSIAEGRGYSSPNSEVPTAFRPPLYPLCLAAVFFVTAPAIAVGEINLVSGLLTVWLTASLGKYFCLGRMRFMPAFLVAVDPLLLQYASRPMTESLCTCLSTFWLWSVTVAWPSTSRRHPMQGVVSGIALGLLVLSRPTFWPIAGGCCLYWLFARLRRIERDRNPAASNFWCGIWSALGTAITVAPWLVRNWLVFGVPILTTTHGGYTLLLGNNPVFYDKVVRQPWGTVWPDASQKEWESNLESQLQEGLGPRASEIERDAWQSRLAKSYIAKEPGHFGEAAIHRVRSLWNTVPHGDAASGVNHWAIAVVGWFYAVLLTLSFIGMIAVLISRERQKWLPLFLLIVTVQIVHLFYWTNTRMRAR